MRKKYYTKNDNGRYEYIGESFMGFPSNGLWYVEDGKENMFFRVGELPDPAPLAALVPYRDEIADAIGKCIEEEKAKTYVKTDDGERWTIPSLAAQADAILLALAKKFIEDDDELRNIVEKLNEK